MSWGRHFDQFFARFSDRLNPLLKKVATLTFVVCFCSRLRSTYLEPVVSPSSVWQSEHPALSALFVAH